ncbi:Hypothetical Protein FCC1311_086532 [Hondaea fermentalgiana]|uniref:Uncharacterized protein n=1 Tax=Hondaea fermentalgiana TaxID=2315210 RepID=A0A2R5GRP4_9STRA|nr:Hypothetical Protein FCC1311_086532 [Hondaea fermentalgiana]|eukprot:GBG32428.1 Hypothetical Protein FCC1311_086532 [Hondaea fermentalgiana]
MPVPPFTAHERLHSARLVFSLSAIDSLSWIVGKAMQFESLQLAKSLDVSYVKIALLLTTVEVAVEFVASALAPYFYRAVQKSTTFTSRNLTAAALKAYGLSCFVATIVYPIMGILIYVVFEPSIGMLATLIVVQSFQYSLLNQVGDALREMAQPHWLHTVQGLDLVIPGRNWARGVLRRPATADSLAVYLQMSFLVISFIFGAVYTVAEDIAIVRWILVLIVAYFNLFVFLSLYRDLPMLQKYIVDKMTDDGKPLVIWLWEMASPERALVLLMLVVTAVPEQAFNALLAVLVLDLEGFLSTVVVGIAALAVFGFLIVRVRRLHKHPRRVPSFDDGAASLDEATFDDGPGLSKHVDTHASIVRQQTASVAKNPESCLRDVFSHWLLAVGGILASLSGGAIGLYLISGTLGIIISMAAFVLVRPFIVQFQTLADRFLFLYDGVRASNIRFWINVATVVVNGPLLALNWWAVSGGLNFVGVDVVEVDEEGETSPEEQRQAAVTLFLSIVIIGVTMVYFVCIDPIMPKSLRKTVRMTPAHAE